MSESNMPRGCGGCTLCCFTHAVGTSEKKLKGADVWCKHCDIGLGCKVYETGRPLACHDFKCAWLEGEGDETERPDKTNVVLCWQYMKYLGQTFVMCGGTPDALTSEYAMRVTEKYVKRRIPLLREHHGGKRELCFDDEVVVEDSLRRAYEAANVKIVYLSELAVTQ
jgi:hypothetical protein